MSVAQRSARYGSVFLPSPALLGRMRARPWTGVFLGEEYLSSVAAAEAITRQVRCVNHTSCVYTLT